MTTSNDILAALSANIRQTAKVDTQRARFMLAQGFSVSEVAEYFEVSESELNQSLNLF